MIIGKPNVSSQSGELNQPALSCSEGSAGGVVPSWCLSGSLALWVTIGRVQD